MIVAAVVVLSLCAVRPRGFVIREDLGATCRVETHLALGDDNVTAN
jgi:hypothetical protein